MFFHGEYRIWKTSLLFTITLVWAIGLADSVGAETHSREFNPRAADEEADKKQEKPPAPRADSVSSSEETPSEPAPAKNREDSSPEEAKPAKPANASDDDDDDEGSPEVGEDGNRGQRSTKGLNAADFEPQDVKLHDRVQEDSDR